MLVTTATSHWSNPSPSRKHAAAGNFQHGRLDHRIHQHRPRALRTAAIPGLDAASVDVDAFGAGHAHVTADRSQDVG